jgi:ankyrin repeat protein
MTTMRMPKPPRQRMIDAIGNNNLQELRNALRAGANVNDRDDNGTPMLHLAVWLNHPSVGVFEAVLSAGPDLDARDIRGMTALHWAARGSDRHLIAKGQALIDAGVDINATTVNDVTALEFAHFNDNQSMVRVIEARQAENLRQQLERNTAQAVAFPDLNDPATLDQVAQQQAQQPKRRGMRL